MSTPKVDPYPEPVALTALDLKRVQRMQVEKGRDARLRRLARRNRDVAWLLNQPQPATPVAKMKKPKVAASTTTEGA
ncbi:MAG TPA: hypothetical protein PKM73_07240 [Verrucomicrobiota bacterium]|nr:hypothetical protein [Verrucomicrobiota bacterium]HNU50157.1 hypothetical protein [Verrucomicrobiota bacterium]